MKKIFWVGALTVLGMGLLNQQASAFSWGYHYSTGGHLTFGGRNHGGGGWGHGSPGGHGYGGHGHGGHGHGGHGLFDIGPYPGPDTHFNFHPAPDFPAHFGHFGNHGAFEGGQNAFGFNGMGGSSSYAGYASSYPSGYPGAFSAPNAGTPVNQPGTAYYAPAPTQPNAGQTAVTRPATQPTPTTTTTAPASMPAQPYGNYVNYNHPQQYPNYYMPSNYSTINGTFYPASWYGR